MSGANSISDILAFLNADQSSAQGSEKVASEGNTAPSVTKEASAMEKIASQIEREQFEKMAQDGWFMGKVMAESFWQTLQEKQAVGAVDTRPPEGIMQSIQGDPPMMAQRTEDLKGRFNVAAQILEAAAHQAVTNKVPASVNPPVEGLPGAAPHMQGAPPPDLQSTDSVAPKTAGVDAQALLLQFLRSNS